MIYINNKILTSVIEFLVIKKLVIVKCKLSGFFLNISNEKVLGILEETKIVSENRVISCIIINTFFFFFVEKRIIINT